MFSFCLALLLSGVSWDEMHTPKQHPRWTTVGGYYTILWPCLLSFSHWYFLLQVPGLVQRQSSKLKPNQLHTQVVRLECVWIRKPEKCFTLECFQKAVGKVFRDANINSHGLLWVTSDPSSVPPLYTFTLLFFSFSIKRGKKWSNLSTKEG